VKNGNGASHSRSDKDGDRICVDFGEAGKLRTLAQQQALEQFHAAYGLWEKEFIATVDKPIETKKTLLFAACVKQFQHATEAWGDPIEVVDWAHDWADYLAIEADAPLPAAEINRMAREHGLTPKVIRSAREALGVKIERDGFGPGSKSLWSLPYMPNTPIDAQQSNWASMESEGIYGGTSTKS
jgi:hypothetical protein